jgi:hypothetical protein
VTLVLWAGQIGRALWLGQMLGQSHSLFGGGRMGIDGQKKRVRRRVSTGAEWYEPGEGAKLLHGGGVFFSGVSME